MKNDRLFDITYLLINKKRVTAKYLAEKFDVSIRTIYRDIDSLTLSGIPIYTERGRDGGIYIMEEYSVNKALFTDKEQIQIMSALESIRAVENVDLSSVMNKLGGIFKKKYQNWLEIDFSSWEDNKRDKEIFSLIKECILNSRVMEIFYYNSNGEKSNRTIEPMKLIFKGHSWYIYAYCKKKADFRFFKLSRIESIKAGNENISAVMPEKIDKEYSKEKSEKIEVLLNIDKSVGFRVYDEFRTGEIKDKGNKFEVKIGLPNNEWLTNYLLGFGKNIEIIKPVELKKEFLKTLEKIKNNNKI